MKKVLLIVGLTAVGKTKLSLKLAHRYNGEVISCDSMQIYRSLNIGTAKLMPKDRQGIPHHLIGIRNVYQRYSVANFVNDALKWIQIIHQRRHLPIIVGGTNLYLQALLDNLNLGGDRFKGFGTRRKLKSYGDQHGKQALWDWLNKVDPKYAEKTPYQNERRVIRALEVYLTTHHRFSEQKLVPRKGLDFLIIGLNTDRQLLYKRINSRVDKMVKQGLLKEARWLYECGGSVLPAGMGIGYHELYPYFDHERSLQDAIIQIKRDSRHYAKHQLTWFRNKMKVNWYDLIQHPEQLKPMCNQIDTWLGKKTEANR